MKKNPVDKAFITFYTSKTIPVRNKVWQKLQRKLYWQRIKQQSIAAAAIFVGLLFGFQIYSDQYRGDLERVQSNITTITMPQLFQATPLQASPLPIATYNSFSQQRKPQESLLLKRYAYNILFQGIAIKSTSIIPFAERIAHKKQLEKEAQILLASVEDQIAQEQLEQEALALLIQIENELAFERTLKGNIHKIIKSFSANQGVAVQQH